MRSGSKAVQPEPARACHACPVGCFLLIDTQESWNPLFLLHLLPPRTLNQVPEDHAAMWPGRKAISGCGARPWLTLRRGAFALGVGCQPEDLSELRGQWHRGPPGTWGLGPA